jgi:hypothetical protein
LVIYREEQLFGWWVYALLGVMMVLSGYFLKLRLEGAEGTDGYLYSCGTIVGFALPAVLGIGLMRMTTLVTASRIVVSFGFIPTYRRVFNAGIVDRIEVVTYRPWLDSKGWGIRTGPDGERILNARGNRGVRVSFDDGGKILIGSQRPEELAAAIQQARLDN